MNSNPKTYQLIIRGLVQGIGFRPFIYRQALKHNVSGTVENNNEFVRIIIQGEEKDINNFNGELKSNAPAAAIIASIETMPIDAERMHEFTILKSSSSSTNITLVSPDIAVCSECIADLKHQKHRIHYPLINCTNCGPRFSIIHSLPYDRANTSMVEFDMCPKCKSEYENISDRRFHAQPVACNDCGPVYEMKDSKQTNNDIIKILQNIQVQLNEGKSIAIKGTGGFHLVCDALNQKAVKALRSKKQRDGNPFAVMFRNIESLRKYAVTTEYEEQLIQSWQRPIVLLKSRKELAYDVCLGFKTLGAMLPSMPFHHMLFENIEQDVLTFTSGNISDEPIIIRNDEAINKLTAITDSIVSYNRNIVNRCDDSVIQVVNEKARFIRRSRGYVPSPIRTPYNVEGILATGSELSNCFAIGKGNQILLSQHIGDLKNPATLNFYEESINAFKNIFRFTPSIIACDLHPNYLSSRYAQASGLPIIQVQHHHAHAASCMAEHAIQNKVIAVCFDGTGLGDDGNIWGGEFLVCDYSNYKRVVHLEYIPLPGGDKVSDQPWRTALSLMYMIYGETLNRFDFVPEHRTNDIPLIITAIDKKINCPLSSGGGRYFDAAAAIIGVCKESSFHAEAPMRLEAAIDKNEKGNYEYEFNNGIISLQPMYKRMFEEAGNVDASIVSARFHNTMVNVIVDTCINISKGENISDIVLSGGVFQNAYLLEKSEEMLRKKGLTVYSHTKIPTNDGGLAVGQMVVAVNNLMID